MVDSNVFFACVDREQEEGSGLGSDDEEEEDEEVEEKKPTRLKKGSKKKCSPTLSLLFLFKYLHSLSAFHFLLRWWVDSIQ